MKGLFITMEGPDGSGKSTQIELLSNYLREKGYDIVITRDPGGNRINEDIRRILLNKEYTEIAYTTEALLYASARAQLVAEIIRPAIEAGKAVISDRFVDSSAVYQGIGRDLGIDTIYKLNEFAMQGIIPDLTIHLDLPATEGLQRARGRAELDRLELEADSFHEKVAEGYRKLAAMKPDRIKTVDATGSIENIHQEIVAYVSKLFD